MFLKRYLNFIISNFERESGKTKKRRQNDKRQAVNTETAKIKDCLDERLEDLTKILRNL